MARVFGPGGVATIDGTIRSSLPTPAPSPLPIDLQAEAGPVAGDGTRDARHLDVHEQPFAIGAEARPRELREAHAVAGRATIVGHRRVVELARGLEVVLLHGDEVLGHLDH